MRLHRRVERLYGRLPGPRPKGVPIDPAALLAGLRDGTVYMEDLDRTDADQVSAVAYVAAMLVARDGMGAAMTRGDRAGSGERHRGHDTQPRVTPGPIPHEVDGGRSSPWIRPPPVD